MIPRGVQKLFLEAAATEGVFGVGETIVVSIVSWSRFLKSLCYDITW